MSTLASSPWDSPSLKALLQQLKAVQAPSSLSLDEATSPFPSSSSSFPSLTLPLALDILQMLSRATPPLGPRLVWNSAGDTLYTYEEFLSKVVSCFSLGRVGWPSLGALSGFEQTLVEEAKIKIIERGALHLVDGEYCGQPFVDALCMELSSLVHARGAVALDVLSAHFAVSTSWLATLVSSRPDAFEGLTMRSSSSSGGHEKIFTQSFIQRESAIFTGAASGCSAQIPFTQLFGLSKGQSGPSSEGPPPSELRSLFEHHVVYGSTKGSDDRKTFVPHVERAALKFAAAEFFKANGFISNDKVGLLDFNTTADDDAPPASSASFLSSFPPGQPLSTLYLSSLSWQLFLGAVDDAASHSAFVSLDLWLPPSATPDDYKIAASLAIKRYNASRYTKTPSIPSPTTPIGGTSSSSTMLSLVGGPDIRSTVPALLHYHHAYLAPTACFFALYHWGCLTLTAKATMGAGRDVEREIGRVQVIMAQMREQKVQSLGGGGEGKDGEAEREDSKAAPSGVASASSPADEAQPRRAKKASRKLAKKEKEKSKGGKNKKGASKGDESASDATEDDDGSEYEDNVRVASRGGKEREFSRQPSHTAATLLKASHFPAPSLSDADMSKALDEYKHDPAFAMSFELSAKLRMKLVSSLLPAFLSHYQDAYRSAIASLASSSPFFESSCSASAGLASSLANSSPTLLEVRKGCLARLQTLLEHIVAFKDGIVLLTPPRWKAKPLSEPAVSATCALEDLPAVLVDELATHLWTTLCSDASDLLLKLLVFKENPSFRGTSSSDGGIGELPVADVCDTLCTPFESPSERQTHMAKLTNKAKLAIESLLAPEADADEKAKGKKSSRNDEKSDSRKAPVGHMQKIVAFVGMVPHLVNRSFGVRLKPVDEAALREANAALATSLHAQLQAFDFGHEESASSSAPSAPDGQPPSSPPLPMFIHVISLLLFTRTASKHPCLHLPSRSVVGVLRWLRGVWQPNAYVGPLCDDVLKFVAGLRVRRLVLAPSGLAAMGLEERKEFRMSIVADMGPESRDGVDAFLRKFAFLHDAAPASSEDLLAGVMHILCALGAHCRHAFNEKA